MKTEWEKFKKVEVIPEFEYIPWRGRNYDLLCSFYDSGEQCMAADYTNTKEARKRAVALRYTLRHTKLCENFSGKIAVNTIGNKLYLTRLS